MAAGKAGCDRTAHGGAGYVDFRAEVEGCEQFGQLGVIEGGIVFCVGAIGESASVEVVTEDAIACLHQRFECSVPKVVGNGKAVHQDDGTPVFRACELVVNHAS